MNCRMILLLLLCAAPGFLFAADWDPNDDTFDPTIHSVVAGDASRLGDPSPFVHMGIKRTGYTYVHTTAWEGFDPSVQISLIVPQKPGDTTPPPTGMLMINRSQTEEFLKAFEVAIGATPDKKTSPKKEATPDKKEGADKKAATDKEPKRVQIKTAFKNANWGLSATTEKGRRFLSFENKSKDRVDTYRFSVNASKKLMGAIQHSLKKLKAKAPK